MKTTITFTDAVKRLAQFGIKKEQVYLIDLLLLIEMAWADGRIQDAEVDILFDYLKKHVKTINRLAGCKVLSEKSAIDFVKTYFKDRPDPQMLAEVQRIVADIRINNKPLEEAETNRTTVLDACLDIAASAVTKYPYGLTERFTADEKACYHHIQQILGSAS